MPLHLFLTLLMPSMAPAVAAQDLWLMAEPPTANDASLRLHGGVSRAFPDQQLSFSLKGWRGRMVSPASELRTLPWVLEEGERRVAARTELDLKGAWMVFLQGPLAHRRWERAEFRDMLRLEGLAHRFPEAWWEAHQGSSFLEERHCFAKLLVRNSDELVGPAPAWRAGAAFELLPGPEIAEARVGELAEFQVLLHSRPLKDARVRFQYPRDGEEAWGVLRCDSMGRAFVPLSRSGWIKVAASWIEAVEGKDGEEDRWRTWSATYCFQVRD